MFACCCVENQEAETQITYHSTTNESIAGLPGQADPAPDPALAGQAEESVPRARSLAPEDKDKEKDRLQRLVNGFARKAVRGAPCTYFNEKTGGRFATQYRIDKGLEYLIVLSSGETDRAEVTCPIVDIQDVYSILEDGESCFPSEVLSATGPGELERLLMVVYRGGHEAVYRFCLLEESREGLEKFLECLRILCIYTQQAASAKPP